MIFDLSALPSDPEQLKAKLIELASAAEEAAAVAEEAVAQRDAALAENEKLLHILAAFKRALYGKRSEKLDPDQLPLIFNQAAAAAATEGPDESRDASAAARKPRKPAERNRGKLPEHLPRIDPEAKTCSCCGGTLHVIGETASEMLDIVPVQYRVKRIIRPRYGCRACENAVVQAPAPSRPVEGGIATEALLAELAVGKFAWHLPLNRQLRLMQAQGIELDRSTLSLWDRANCLVAETSLYAAARFVPGAAADVRESTMRRRAPGR
jgi:transposase